MVSKLSTLVAAAVVSAAFVAGCGSSSNSTSTAQSTGTSSSSASASGSGGGASAATAVQQAVAACKSRVNDAATLTTDAKAKLISLCEQASSGNVAAAEQATKEVCQDVAKSLPSAVRATAEAACAKV